MQRTWSFSATRSGIYRLTYSTGVLSLGDLSGLQMLYCAILTKQRSRNEYWLQGFGLAVIGLNATLRNNTLYLAI